MSLDPKDWDAFRKEAHDLLDSCIDHIAGAADKPWQPLDQAAKDALSLPLPKTGMGTTEIAQTLRRDLMPYATGNTHPRFFGWVHGTGLASGLLSEMVAASMNSNCGGREHGATHVERNVIEWCKEIFEFPSGASGLLTTGTSQATIIALVAARVKTLGRDVRKNGIKDAPALAAYCADGAHSCVAKALEILGHGSQSLRKIPTDGPSGSIKIDALQNAIAQDRTDGLTPFCIIGTAGSVNTGAFDDLNGLADLCEREDLWLHVDGAFGAWAKIADAPWNGLTDGLSRADSVAFDFHKWMSMPYDCGGVLVRDGTLHYDSFATRPAYLAKQAEGLGGGDLWFCDFGTELSRGFRALKVWTALQEHGLEAFSAAITGNCAQAAYMAQCVEASNALSLGAPVVSNVCTFRAHKSGLSDEDSDVLNTKIVQALQLNGIAVFSTTKIDERIMIRAAIVNHRTTLDDVKLAVSAVENAILEI